MIFGPFLKRIINRMYKISTIIQINYGSCPCRIILLIKKKIISPNYLHQKVYRDFFKKLRLNCDNFS